MGSFKIVQRLTDADMTRAPRVLKQDWKSYKILKKNFVRKLFF